MVKLTFIFTFTGNAIKIFGAMLPCFAVYATMKFDIEACSEKAGVVYLYSASLRLISISFFKIFIKTEVIIRF